MNKKRLCIIPFNKKIIPVLMNWASSYELIGVVFPGSEMAHRDIQVFENRDRSGVLLTSDYADTLSKCDLVVINDIGQDKMSYLYQYIKECIDTAIANARDIICFAELEKKDQVNYSAICKEIGINFKYIKPQNYSKKEYKHFGHMDTPIILIGEMIPDCNRYEIALKLLQRFEKDQLKAILISDDRYNTLYEQNYIKYWNSVNPEKNIKNLNGYVNDLDKKYNPDVFIVTCSAPMLAYDEKIIFDFGLTAFLISNALRIDYCILCCPYGYLSEAFINEINSNFKAKYGYNIYAYHFGNCIVDQTDEEKDYISIIHDNNRLVINEIKKYRKKKNSLYYNLIDDMDFEEFYVKLYEELFAYSYGVIENG